MVTGKDEELGFGMGFGRRQIESCRSDDGVEGDVVGVEEVSKADVVIATCRIELSFKLSPDDLLTVSPPVKRDVPNELATEMRVAKKLYSIANQHITLSTMASACSLDSSSSVVISSPITQLRR